MADIPASLLIRPNEARERFRIALEGLLEVFGYKRVAVRLQVNERTLGRWKGGKTKPDYFVAITLIAWYDRDVAKTEHFSSHEQQNSA